LNDLRDIRDASTLRESVSQRGGSEK